MEQTPKISPQFAHPPFLPSSPFATALSHRLDHPGFGLEQKRMRSMAIADLIDIARLIRLV